VTAVRAAIPESTPLWLRISGTEWMDHVDEPSWNLASSIALAKLLPSWGVDVLDVSSGGNDPRQRFDPFNDFQINLASEIRRAVRADGLALHIAAVGRITEAEKARSIVQPVPASDAASSNKAGAGDGTIEVEMEGGLVAKADFVLAARQFLRDPQFVLKSAHELNVDVKWPNQYERAKPKPKHRL
jgi:2,4-dienoyl-CoA reductase-like NADH-dependent reductase (Old Yellow Enzyme family)